MTEHEKQLFEKLNKDRNENAIVLEKQSMSGLWRSIVDKYTDQAHFVYELIQNADDVGATEARFELYYDRLVFIHNGVRHFNISDVDDEALDTKQGKLGDLNAITSVANSNKTDASIGKFGVGFKAVFQYTTNPIIYDPQTTFMIRNYIVPILIDDKFDEKENDETAFVFPFNHPDRGADRAFNDISKKLQNLLFPTLFLNNLKSIKYKIENISGEYRKKILEKRELDDTTAEKIEYQNGDDKQIYRMWMFSRVTEEKYKYSVGFLFDENEKLIKSDYYAFCFFPTKKTTNLNFIINAPFLLTDSREGIKADSEHNIRMISLLAELSADGFEYLRDIGLGKGCRYIDDDILDYLPINRDLYIPDNESDDISFGSFYVEIRKKFCNCALLPSFSDYATVSNAYTPYWAVIAELISNEQLSALLEEPNAKWIIPSKGYETYYRARDGKADYLRGLFSNRLGSVYIEDIRIIEMLTPDFIMLQTKEWILSLYSFILETEKRVARAKTAPIFINQRGEAMPAYDKTGVALLFYDDDSIEGYDTISDEYISEDITKEIVKRFDIKAPELKDKVYQKILKKETIDQVEDFHALLDFYIELKNQFEFTENYISQIKKKTLISGISEDGTSWGQYKPDELYLPNDDLKHLYNGTGDIKFVDTKKYTNILKDIELKYLDSFLCDLGVSRNAKRIEWEYSESEVSIFKVRWPNSTQYRRWYDYRIDHDEFIVNKIIDSNDVDLSIALWKQLVLLCTGDSTKFQDLYLGGAYAYFYRKRLYYSYSGFGLKLLREKNWIVNREGELCNSGELSIQELDNRYETDGDAAKRLLQLLKITDSHPEYSSLDKETRARLEKADKFEKMGLLDLSPEIMDKIEAYVKSLKQSDNNPEEESPNSQRENDKNQSVSPEERVLDEIKNRVRKSGDSGKQINNDKGTKEKITIDTDELTKAPVDYAKKIEKAKQKFEEDVAKLAQEEAAQTKAVNSKRYSYAWFSALLELEALNDGDDNSRSREVSISFSRVERESNKNRTLLLKFPSRNIPQVMEELVDIPLDLTFVDGSNKRLVIEAANVQSYVLRVKVKQDDFIETADFSNVNQALIVAKNPSFLTRELLKQFTGMKGAPTFLDDSFDMQMNLCDNIRFIFGPPGTGKTTYLARNTLIPLVNNNERCKILVLAPTNKSADVLVTRIMQQYSDDSSYTDWLVRYGVTCDEEIEKSGVFHGKNFDINAQDKNVIVTTMVRFSYDYFIDSDGRYNYLRGINWDYIVVDEASMIPLVQMVYMLYLKTPKEFIIAGDPFQIEPTTSVSEWKDENIYKMVHLREFSDNVTTIPHKYDIKLLTTQYRSIPCVGGIYSELTYNGLLKHSRSEQECRPLNIERYLEYSNLNIIKFPVSKYESIYKAKRLKMSNFQVYSALFAYEFVSYISNAIARCNGGVYKLGIISPYTAQAGLIDKLIASADLPKTVNVNVGTIHKFQGDECDAIFALFNPPPGISSSDEMFLNRQNIINVAISRARDYLFILMPDDDTENVQNLVLINKLVGLMKKNSYTEKNTDELEFLMFGNENYLEENAFSTGHQLVNVYGIPEKRYEIRSEENAVDVQIHGESKYIPFLK